MFNISIVLYNPDWDEVKSLVAELVQARSLRKLYLVDNSPEETRYEKTSTKERYIWNKGKNLGYGAAHNIAIRESVWYQTPFHLVMNADIVVHHEDLDRLHRFMEENEKVGQVMPHVVYPDGQTQYLCKLLPTPLDVFGRRFLPASWMKKRNERYELHKLGYDRILNVPYLSGCFMFLRTEAVLKARLFDERYFMYPEDIDLTRTIHRDYLTLYLPDITIIHNHEQGSYKNPHLLKVHIINMCRYFNKWGWVFDKERRLFNRLTLQQ